MALTVKLNNVSEVIPLDTVPVIVAEPEPVFNDRPVGKDPDCTAKDVALVAVIVIVEIVDPAPNEPKLPAEVTHAGASETVNTAPVCTALPSGFSIYSLYVPSTGKVNLAVILVADENDTSSATTVAPVELLIAVTKGTDTKLVPAIVQVVCVFSIVDGVIELNVGLVSVVKVIDPPSATA